MPLSPVSITNLDSIPESSFGPVSVTNLESIPPVTLGPVTVGELESAGDLYEVDIETSIRFKTKPFYAIKKTPRSRKLNRVKLKNVSNNAIFLYKIVNSKSFSDQPKVIRLSPRQTINIVLEAYDSLRIEELQKKSKLQVSKL